MTKLTAEEVAEARERVRQWSQEYEARGLASAGRPPFDDLRILIAATQPREVGDVSRLATELCAVARALDLVDFHAREADLDLNASSCRSIVKEATAALTATSGVAIADGWRDIASVREPTPESPILVWHPAIGVQMATARHGSTGLGSARMWREPPAPPGSLVSRPSAPDSSGTVDREAIRREVIEECKLILKRAADNARMGPRGATISSGYLYSAALLHRALAETRP